MERRPARPKMTNELPTKNTSRQLGLKRVFQRCLDQLDAIRFGVKLSRRVQFGKIRSFQFLIPVIPSEEKRPKEPKVVLLAVKSRVPKPTLCLSGRTKQL